MARIKYLISASQRGAISIAYAMAVIIVLFVLASALLTSVGTDLRGSNDRLMQSKVFFAAESGLELAIKKMNNGDSGVISGVSIDGVTVSTSVTNDTILISTATKSQLTRRLQVFVHRSPSLGPFNTFCTGSFSDVWSYDEYGRLDWNLARHHQHSMPRINYSGLIAMAHSQGHNITNYNFTPTNNYPNGSFYYSPGVPNVIHVTHNMNVMSGRTIYGIYVVDGNVTMDGNAHVQGIVYLATYNSNFSFYGYSSPYHHNVCGGILAHGNVWSPHHCSWASIRYRREYMEIFNSFMDSGGEFSVTDWKEL